MPKYLRLALVILYCLYFWHYAKTYTDWHFIDYVNLIFHEAGHVIFRPFGEFVSIAMGSGFQILLPCLITAYFFYTRQKISAALCLLWVGQNLLNVSIYARDAINMQLDLLGGDSVIHDWNYLLTTLGVLPDTPIIASTMYWIGLAIIMIGSVLAIVFTLDDSKTPTLTELPNN